jgi:hypothetical protein
VKEKNLYRQKAKKKNEEILTHNNKWVNERKKKKNNNKTKQKTQDNSLLILFRPFAHLLTTFRLVVIFHARKKPPWRGMTHFDYLHVISLFLFYLLLLPTSFGCFTHAALLCVCVCVCVCVVARQGHTAQDHCIYLRTGADDVVLLCCLPTRPTTTSFQPLLCIFYRLYKRLSVVSRTGSERGCFFLSPCGWVGVCVCGVFLSVDSVQFSYLFLFYFIYFFPNRRTRHRSQVPRKTDESMVQVGNYYVQTSGERPWRIIARDDVIDSHDIHAQDRRESQSP